VGKIFRRQRGNSSLYSVSGESAHLISRLCEFILTNCEDNLGKLDSETNKSIKVTVIIATMARVDRRMQLRRAVSSIRASSNQRVRIIVVVNGNQFDTILCDWLRMQADVQLEMAPTLSLPTARRRGRELVRTEFFSTLDDDDEYLPLSTDMKMQGLATNGDADFLIGNSFENKNGVDLLMYEKLPIVSSNPLKHLMQFAWLHNGNALFRTDAIGLDYFVDLPHFAEWTWLAFRLAHDNRKLAVLDVPVFRYNDTTTSLSKTEDYLRSHIPLFKRMLSFPLPPDIIKMIRRKISASHHESSLAAKNGGRLIEAWRHHMKSLFIGGGIRYVSHTRHLLKY
jgi:hypothetical protein